MTETPLTDICVSTGLVSGVWTPEKSPTIPKCTLPSSSWCWTGSGELGADGRFTVVGGVSLRDTEHVTAPDFTNFLWVVQIWLYCLLILRLLGGTDLVEHSWSVFRVGWWEFGGVSSLWVVELRFPDWSSSISSLLLSTPLKTPLKLS